MNKKNNLNFIICLLLISSQFIFSQNYINKIFVDVTAGKDTINRNIYGHFAEHLGRCIYDGIWVGEDSKIPNINGYRKDVVEALKELEIPVLRWPGGCFADTYHWKDGIGPKEQRPTIENFFWGSSIEDNSFGTHEFLDLCELIGTEPYLAVNVGSGTPREVSEWIEYVTSDKNTPMAKLRKQNGREKSWNVKYWGIGNESWGCGGNMTADYYADLYNRFASYSRVNFKIASGGTPEDYDWTETLLKKTIGNNKNIIDGISFHHYTVSHTWAQKGSATDFKQDDWFLTVSKNLEVEDILKKHIDLFEKYDKNKKVFIYADEWGNWHDPAPGTNPGHLYQQNTLRDAISAAVYLNIFNNHCDRVKMANIAQTVNVLQAMLLTNDKEVLKTPTFYVFKMYKAHFDAVMLPTEMICEKYSHNNASIPALNVSASKNSDGKISITVANLNPEKDIETTITLNSIKDLILNKGEIVTGDKINSYNDFEKMEEVSLKEYTEIDVDGNNVKLTIPSKSVILISLN